MLSFLTLLILILYSTCIFFVESPWYFISFFAFNLLVAILLNIPLKKHLTFLLKSLPFLVFIALCNLLTILLSSPSEISIVFLIFIRLALVIDLTFCASFFFTPERLEKAFSIIFQPLKLFKINVEDLSVMTAVALAFVPILVSEARTLKLSLRAHGFDFTIKNAIKNPEVFINTFLDNLFDRTESLEKSLKLKAF